MQPARNSSIKNPLTMKKLITMKPGRLEEIVIVVFFILFFALTIIAESTGQVTTYYNVPSVNNVKNISGYSGL